MKKALVVIDVQQAITETKELHIESTLFHINYVIEHFDGRIIYIKHIENGSEFDPNDHRSHLSSKLLVKSEYIYEKYHHSAFYETPLDGQLKKWDIEEVIIVGFQTEYCIDATIKTGHFLGYKMILLRECHHTFDREINKETLIKHYENQLSLYADVVHYKEFLETT
jgi:nicotinamidase-related amidase